MRTFNKQRDLTQVSPIPLHWTKPNKRTVSYTTRTLLPLLSYPFLTLDEDRYKYIGRSK